MNRIGKEIFKKAKKTNKKDLLKYCNRYSLIVNFFMGIACVGYIGFYKNYYGGQQIELEYYLENIQNSQLSKQDTKFFLYYIAACIALIYLCINTYVRVYHSDQKFVKYWIGFTCLDQIF